LETKEPSSDRHEMAQKLVEERGIKAHQQEKGTKEEIAGWRT